MIFKHGALVSVRNLVFFSCRNLWYIVHLFIHQLIAVRRKVLPGCCQPTRARAPSAIKSPYGMARHRDEEIAVIESYIKVSALPKHNLSLVSNHHADCTTSYVHEYRAIGNVSRRAAEFSVRFLLPASFIVASSYREEEKHQKVFQVYFGSLSIKSFASGRGSSEAHSKVCMQYRTVVTVM